jgi:hypothetical protein
MSRILPLLLITSLLYCCKKENQTTQEFGSYILRLIDSPGNYEHVYIDIQDISVNVSGTGWVDIGPQAPGIYDLLAYNNGLDTLLSNATLPSGTISQIRLLLGTNNTITVNGISYNLTIPSLQQNGLKINVNTSIPANGSVVQWIDFDAGKSIVELGNNNYQLKPVLRTFTENTNGKISGTLLPPDAQAYIRAIQGNDTLIAIPESNGFFQFSGLSGTYELDFIPDNPNYSSVITYNNSVSGNQLLNIGIVTLP